MNAPDLPEIERKLLSVEVHYGCELAQAVRRYLADRDASSEAPRDVPA